jgi:hypothetical protein
MNEVSSVGTTNPPSRWPCTLVRRLRSTGPGHAGRLVVDGRQGRDPATHQFVSMARDYHARRLKMRSLRHATPWSRKPSLLGPPAERVRPGGSRVSCNEGAPGEGQGLRCRRRGAWRSNPGRHPAAGRWRDRVRARREGGDPDAPRDPRTTRDSKAAFDETG